MPDVRSSWDRCGICSRAKIRRSYQPGADDGVTRDALLCQRCDLTPEPPVKRFVFERPESD